MTQPPRSVADWKVAVIVRLNTAAMAVDAAKDMCADEDVVAALQQIKWQLGAVALKICGPDKGLIMGALRRIVAEDV